MLCLAPVEFIIYGNLPPRSVIVCVYWFFLFCLYVVPSAALASTCRIINSELELKRRDLSLIGIIKSIWTKAPSTTRSKNLMQLADELAAARRYMEAVWLYEAAGNSLEAQKLESKIIQTLAEERIIEFKSRTLSSRNMQIAVFANAMEAIMRETSAKGVDKETAMHNLSKLTGLNTVPVTVHRIVNLKHYPLQLFVEGAETSEAWGFDSYGPYMPMRILVFNHISGNSFDRHNHNILISPLGIPLTIDNRSCFYFSFAGVDPAELSPYIPASTVKYLSEITYDQILEAIKHPGYTKTSTPTESAERIAKAVHDAIKELVVESPRAG